MAQQDSGDTRGPRFEGYELPALLTVDDIFTILNGTIPRLTIVRWFRRGRLHGLKPGKAWVIRASTFLEDWALLERDLGVFAPANRVRVDSDGAIAPRPLPLAATRVAARN